MEVNLKQINEVKRKNVGGGGENQSTLNKIAVPIVKK